MRHLIRLLTLLIATPIAAQPTLSSGIPITVNAPPRVSGIHSWPVTTGIPFPQGLVGGVGSLTIVDDTNRAVPCQIDTVTTWRADHTVRWARADFVADPARTYRLIAGARASFQGITVQQTLSGLTVTTGPARYFFPAGAAMFDRVDLDLNKDRVFQTTETIVNGARNAFYVRDSNGQRAVLGSGTVTVENPGPMHAVVRASGTYLAGSATRAAATIYFHFYAGVPQVRISHKLIITEDTETLWLFQSGLTIPFTSTLATASFNNDHDRPLAFNSNTVRTGDEALMAQLDVAHHDRDAANFSVELRHGSTNTVVQRGAMAGDWADLSDGRVGFTAQVPAFAEQAPKTFRVTPTALTIELWSDYGGLELDFRRNTVFTNNFSSWFNAFASDPAWASGHGNEIGDGNSTLPSNGTGSAKVHDIWLYPHAGGVQPATLGATREEIVARADPAWIAASGVFGPIHQRDTVNFAKTEEAIDDYYARSVFISQQVFPQTGYFFYGQYPFIAQPWEFRGRWYPEWHRLGRQLDYNLRRSVWVLWARGGDRRYFDFARRNTRHLGDFLFSNAAVTYKPLGWTVEGLFHSAIPWGQYGRGTPGYSSNSSACLATASSEDVIQFVYDYFLTGDLHSRDAARNWKNAMLGVMQPGVDMNEAVLRVVDYQHASGPHPNAFELPYLFLRVLGSAYELEDNSDLVFDFGHAVLEKLTDNGGTDNILNPTYRTNYTKQLEVFSSYYHYWISTGDPLAQTVLLRYADFAYRFGRVDRFFDRHNGAAPMAFAVAYQDRRDPSLAAYLAQAAREFGRTTVTLANEGHTEASFTPTNSLSWKPEILDEQSVVGIGVPLAMAAAVDAAASGVALPEVPYADKPLAAQPAYLVFSKGTGAARIDVYVNDIGGRSVVPVLHDLTGGTFAVTELARQEHREIEPPAGVTLGDRQWIGMADSQVFLSLSIPATVPAGVYKLDLGRDVAVRVLYTDLTQIEQVAPDGIVISPGKSLLFTVPSGTSAVDLFAYRGFKVFDSANQEIPTTHLGDPLLFGNFSFTPTASARFSVAPGSDPYFAPGTSAGETFVRFLNIPPVVASGDAARIFSVPSAPFPSQLDLSVPSSQYAAGHFDQSIVLQDSVVEATPPAGFPFAEGTIEFWMRPLWSTTDLAIDRTSGTLTVPIAKRTELFLMLPFHIRYRLEPDNSGVTPRYLLSSLFFQIDGVQNGNKGGTAVKYPVRVYFQQGRWYHIAITWKIDGVNSDIAFFVDGREKSFELFDEDLGAIRSILNYAGGTLPAPGGPIQFGAGNPCPGGGHCALPGDQFDELRISRVRRYAGDFVPPSGPFSPDPQTYLLMHFNNNLDVAAGSTTATIRSSP